MKRGMHVEELEGKVSHLWEVTSEKDLLQEVGNQGGKKVDVFYLFVSWLASHVQHWDEANNSKHIS